MTVFLDTSVVLRVLLQQPNRLAAWRRWERAFASDILGVEARRAIDRLRLDAALDDAGIGRIHHDLRRVERAVARIPPTRAVLQRAALPFPTVVKTLDAIHLATAMLLAERRAVPLVFATHDGQQAAAAAALGFDCIGV